MAKKFLTDINIAGGVYDSSGDIGSSGQVLSSTGSGINWIDANSAASVVYQDGFTGNGSATAFTLANSIDNENKTQVYIDGVYQHKDNYSLSGTTLTFSTAPPNTSDIEVISFSTVSSADDILYDTDFASAGLMTTNGSGVYSITTNNSSNWNTAYTHSQAAHAPANAEQNVQSDWTATSGDSFIQNKPTIPSGNQIIDWTADQGSTEIHSGNYINTTYTVGNGGLTQNNFTNALKTKLDGIETSADVTDTANVTAAGALMDSELTDLAGVKGVTISNLATVSYVDTEVAGLVDSSPTTLDTLNELAAALGDDPNFATTTANSIGLKAPLASPTFTGIITASSSSSGDYVRLYGSSGTGKWDIYGNGANLRISDNESAGILVVDTGATFGGTISGSGIELSNYMQVKVDDAEIYWTNTANNDYWRWKRDASNNFICDHYNGSSTTAALSFDTSQNATFAGNLNISSPGDLYINSGTSYNNKGSIFMSNQRTEIVSDIVNATANGDTSLNFKTRSAGATASAMFIDEFRRVGIGTTSPTRTLDVFAANNFDGIALTDSADTLWNILKSGSSVNTSYFNMFSQGVTKVRIHADNVSYFNGGNVGIGTTSPSAKLTIDNGSASGGSLLKSSSSDYTAHFIGNTGTGSAGIYMDAMDGDFIGSNYGFIGQNNAGYMEYTVSPSSPLPYHYFAQSVGIGTTSPANKLTVVTAGSSAIEVGLRLVNPIGFTSAGSGVKIAFAQDRSDSENYEMAAIESKQSIAGTSSNGDLAFFTRESSALKQRLRITAGGSIAIPNDSGSFSGAASLILTKKSSVPYIQYQYSGTSTSFRLEMDEYVTAGNVRQYFTQTNGGVGNGFSMTFNTGSVIFGDLEVASATQNSGSAFKKDSKARMTLCQASNSTALTDLQEYFNPNGAVGKIQTSGSATLFTTSSDYRLKEDLKSFSGLEMVSKIPVYDFKWKISDERSYGVMAHELQEVLPQAVGGDKDYEKKHVVKKAEYDDDHNLIKDAEYGMRPSYQTVDYSKIVPLLVKSIQELKAEVEELKTQINN